MTHRRLVVLGLAAGASLLAAYASPESDVIWQGDVVRSISTIDIELVERGDVAVRIPRLVPGGPDEAIETTSRPTVFTIDVKVTRRPTDKDGFALPQSVSNVGTISLATYGDKTLVRKAVRDIVRGIQVRSPKNFALPMLKEHGSARSDFSFVGSPLFSEPPSWICFEPADGSAAIEVLTAQRISTPSGGTGLRTSSLVEMPARHLDVCRQLRELQAEGGAKQTYSSRPAIESAGRQALLLSIHRPGRGKASVPLPDGVLLKSQHDDAAGGMKITAHSAIVDFPLSIARSTSVVMQWVLDRRQDSSVIGDGTSASNAVPTGDWILAIYPPMSERAPGEIQPDPTEWEERLARRADTQFRDWIRKEFEDTTRLDPADVERVALSRVSELLGSEHSLIIVCDGNNAGTYVTHPTGSRTRIKNGDVLCSELRRSLAAGD